MHIHQGLGRGALETCSVEEELQISQHVFARILGRCRYREEWPLVAGT